MARCLIPDQREIVLELDFVWRRQLAGELDDMHADPCKLVYRRNVATSRRATDHAKRALSELRFALKLRDYLGVPVCRYVLCLARHTADRLVALRRLEHGTIALLDLFCDNFCGKRLVEQRVPTTTTKISEFIDTIK